jgi:carbon-monoxide dehydrogenase medium subunit
MTLLVALGAHLGVASADGTRRVAAHDFVRGPFATALLDGELLTYVDVPAPLPGAYLKFQLSGRVALGLAVAGPVQQGAFGEAPRVVVGAAVMTPTLCPEAAALLVDRPLLAGDAGVRRAAEAAAEEVDPYPDPFASASYKRRLVRTLLPRAVERLALKDAA